MMFFYGQELEIAKLKQQEVEKNSRDAWKFYEGNILEVSDRTKKFESSHLANCCSLPCEA